MRSLLCKIFGHKLTLAQGEEETWKACERCLYTELVIDHLIRLA